MSSWIVSGLDGIYFLHSMSWRIVLRDIRSHSCNGNMLIGIIFCFFRHRVFKLPCWELPINLRLFKLYFLSRRLILCHHGLDCSDRSLRSGIILCRICYCMFKLYIGIVLLVGIFNELL